jgi:hypothetical protein
MSPDWHFDCPSAARRRRAGQTHCEEHPNGMPSKETWTSGGSFNSGSSSRPEGQSFILEWFDSE